jgi:hypothetical protein
MYNQFEIWASRLRNIKFQTVFIENWCFLVTLKANTFGF